MTTDKQEPELGIGECSVQCWICPYCHDDHADPKVCNQDYLRERVHPKQEKSLGEKVVEILNKRLSPNMEFDKLKWSGWIDAELKESK